MSFAAARRSISESVVTPRVSYVELSSSELAPVDADDDFSESGERPTTRALTPALRARGGRRMRTITSLAVFAALGVVGYLEQKHAVLTRFAARMLDTSPRASSATIAALPAPHTAGCTLAAPPRRIARRALASTGIELAVEGSRVALGFASSPLDGIAMELDPSVFSPRSVAKITTTRPLRRVFPIFAQDDALDALADDESHAPPAALQKLEGRAPIEALRIVPLGDAKGLAVAYRREGTIWVASLAGTPPALDGPPLPISEPKSLVGRPSIAVVGDTIVVAWASRTSASQSWSVRWTRSRIGSGFVEASRALTIPPGAIGEASMSPSVTALGNDAFVVAWTEGTELHRVRAQAYGLDGAREGEPLAISAPSENAGQGEIAVGSDRRGIAAFLVKGEGAEMELFAAPIACE